MQGLWHEIRGKCARRSRMNTFLPFVSTLVTLAFACVVLDQYVARRRPYQLVWSLGLLWFFLGTSSEFVAGLGGWSDGLYRLWYLAGAIFAAAYLGMGTVYLLTPKRFANVVMALLVLGSLYAVYSVATAQIDPEALVTTSNEVRPHTAVPGNVRIQAAIFNSFGTIALVGGAVYSAWVFWRRRILAYRVASNVLIAAGAIIVAFSGSLATLGNPSYLFLGELLGVIVIFLGFLRSREVFGLYRFPLVHGFRRIG